jgi:hypothetical protein
MDFDELLFEFRLCHRPWHVNPTVPFWDQALLILRCCESVMRIVSNEGVHITLVASASLLLGFCNSACSYS